MTANVKSVVPSIFFSYFNILKLLNFDVCIYKNFFIAGAMPMVTATTFCLPKIVRWTSVVSYCLLSLWGLYKVSKKLPYARSISYLIFLISNFPLIFLK